MKARTMLSHFMLNVFHTVFDPAFLFTRLLKSSPLTEVIHGPHVITRQLSRDSEMSLTSVQKL